MVKLEVLWPLTATPGQARVLVNKTFGAIFPVPQAQGAVAALSCCLPFAVPLHTLPRAQLCSRATTARAEPSVTLAQGAPSHLACLRNPAGSAQLHFMELLFLEEKSISNSVCIILTNKSVFIQLSLVAMQSLQQGWIWVFFLPKTGLQVLLTVLKPSWLNYSGPWLICASWIEAPTCFASMVSKPCLGMTPGRTKESTLTSFWNSSSSNCLFGWLLMLNCSKCKVTCV